MYLLLTDGKNPSGAGEEGVGEMVWEFLRGPCGETPRRRRAAVGRTC